LRRRAVAQHLDPLDRERWDARQIGCLRTARAEQGRPVIALAVDQHERLIRGQAAQRRRADECLAVSGGQALDVERR
jgi:hypothetical protein